MNEKAWEEMNDELQKNIHHNGYAIIISYSQSFHINNHNEKQ